VGKEGRGLAPPVWNIRSGAQPRGRIVGGFGGTVGRGWVTWEKSKQDRESDCLSAGDEKKGGGFGYEQRVNVGAHAFRTRPRSREKSV